MYNKLFFYIIAFLHFMITLFFDNYFFIPEDYYKNQVYISTKIISLIVIFYFWHKLCDILNDLKNNNPKTKIFVIFFSIHFILNLIFCILTLPSIYTHDAQRIIYDTISFENFMSLNSWFPNIFYMLSFEIIPFDFAHVLMTEIIISLAVGNIMKLLSNIFSIKYLSIIFLLFLFPTLFLLNAFPFRSGLLGYLFLLLGIIFFEKYTLKKDFTLKELFFCPVFAALITIIRSESIIFAITIPLAFILIFFKLIPIRQIVVFCLFFYFSLSMFLTPVLKQNNVQKYGINTIMTNFDYIINENENNWQKLIIIKTKKEKDILMHNTEYDLLVVKNIIINNWKILLKQRTIVFLRTINLTHFYDFEHWDGYYLDSKFYFPKLQKKIFKFYDSPFMYKIRYNVLIPIGFLLMSLGTGIFKRNRFFIYWAITVLTYFAVLFIIIPHPHFDYMASIFLSGLILPVCYLMHIIEKFIMNKKCRQQNTTLY